MINNKNTEIASKITEKVISLTNKPLSASAHSSAAVVETRDNIQKFIALTVNGDDYIDDLAVKINRDNKEILLVYILTKQRLIKIDFDLNNNEIDSDSFPLNTIVGITRNLLQGGRIEFGVSFQNGSFGLRYSIEDEYITNFFQKIEQLKARPSA